MDSRELMEYFVELLNTDLKGSLPEDWLFDFINHIQAKSIVAVDDTKLAQDIEVVRVKKIERISKEVKPIDPVSPIEPIGRG